MGSSKECNRRIPAATVAGFFTALQQAVSGEADKIPDGFYTSEEWGKAMNCTADGARKKLKRAGAEERSFRTHDGAKLRTLTHYKIKN